MRITSILLFATVGLLITGGDEPDGGGEVHALRMELSAALARLHSSQLEIVRLKEELDECVQGHLCDLLLLSTTFFILSCAENTLAFTWQVHRHIHTSKATAQLAPTPGPFQAGGSRLDVSGKPS